jgi:predicted dithiol-disulfide oxidoreductase (DUF899 family)
MSFEKIQQYEKDIHELNKKLTTLRAETPAKPVHNYKFRTLSGTTTLKDMFADKEQLMVIHNMGQGCRYCTLWGDGINPFLPHLENMMSVVLVSKDSPELQRIFANSRNWRFQMASHGGGSFMLEQSNSSHGDNFAGISVFELRDSNIMLKNRSEFGPYDQFCSMWNLLSLAGLNEESWTPQYNYWQRPTEMDDGGENLN